MHAGAPDEALAGDGAAPSYSIECREHACRLSVLEVPGAPGAGAWITALQTSDEVRRLSRRGVLFAGADWTKDPISGARMRPYTAYIALP